MVSVVYSAPLQGRQTALAGTLLSEDGGGGYGPILTLNCWLTQHSRDNAEVQAFGTVGERILHLPQQDL